MGFTFKEHRTTGLAAVADSGYTDIKLNKLIVGHFDNRTPHQIRLAIKDDGEKCGFSWIHLKKESKSKDEVRQWLNDNCQLLFERYDLHQFED